MPYGNGQRLGETIDPRLMQTDYSGFERAGQTMGNAFAQAGADVGGMIKQKAENERRIKKAEQMAKSIRDAIPELATMGDNALAELSNPDLSTNQRLAIAAGIEDSLKIGILGLDRQRDASMMDWEREKFERQMGLNERQIALSMLPSGKLKETDVPVEGGTQRVLIDESGNYYDPLTKEPITPTGSQIPNLQGANIQSALPIDQGGLYPSGANAVDMTEEEIMRLAAQTPEVGGVDVDGGMGVLPPRPQMPEDIAAQGIAQASKSRFGFKPNDSAVKQKPELVTLDDGTKAYGSFDERGVFQPAMKDGKPMTFTEGQTLTAKEAADIKMKQEETAKATVASLDKSEQFLGLLDKLEKHKGFSNLFGTNVGVPTWVPGSDAADAKVLFKQIDAKGFMEAIKEMKGMGALSNAEGEKASAAFLGLDPSMSEDAAKEAIKGAKEIIKVGIQRAKSGNLLPTDAVNPRAANADRLRSLTTNPLAQ